MLAKTIFLKCKSCGYEWNQEVTDIHILFYCPKCGMIGHIKEHFILVES